MGVCLGGWSPAGMHVLAHTLWQQRCLEVDSRLHHVGVVDETRRTSRHHGRQRDAPRRIASFRHATLRVAPHRYATPEPLGKPGGSRVQRGRSPLKRLWLRDGHVKRNICERMNSPLRDVPCSNADIDLRPERDLAGRHHRIPTNQAADFSDGHLRLAQFDLSQKSDKVAVLLGIYCFPRFRSRTDGRRERWLAVPKAVGALRGWFKVPLRPGVADALTIRACKRRA